MVTGNVKQFAIVENPADIITKKKQKLKIKRLSDRVLRLYICGNIETAASAKDLAMDMSYADKNNRRPYKKCRIGG